jgi:hypothetical protein
MELIVNLIVLFAVFVAFGSVLAGLILFFMGAL